MGSGLHLAGPGMAATLTGTPAAVRFTNRADGDMADSTGVDPIVAGRRRSVVDRPWTWLRQVHGVHVVVVERPGDGAGEAADGAVSATPGTALAILTADCAPLAMASPEGVIGAAHAGWRGLLGGVVEATVAAMRSLGATDVVAALGPCIHPECYEFAGPQLDDLASRLGPAVRGRHRDGGPALDVPAAVRSALARSAATLIDDTGVCTGCSPRHWSWRARADESRQATVVWCP